MRLEEIKLREKMLLGVLGYRLDIDWDCVWWLYKGHERVRPAEKATVEAWEKVLYLPWKEFKKEIAFAQKRKKGEEGRGGLTYLPGGGAGEGGV